MKLCVSLLCVSLLCVSLYGVAYGNQTSKVYEADALLVGVNGIIYLDSREKASKYLDKIYNDAWFKNNFKIRKPVVVKEFTDYKLTSTIGSNVANGRGTISVPDRGCYNFSILHEVAHHIRPNGEHEREFTKMYLILIEHFTNPNVAKELKSNYRRFGVQF